MPQGRLEEIALPHLDTAFNYARWLTKNEADAEDAVQDAAVPALRGFPRLDARDHVRSAVKCDAIGRIRRVALDQRSSGFTDQCREDALVGGSLDEITAARPFQNPN
jgi:RNA polymerase sigma-70 factor, ECF subfamily